MNRAGGRGSRPRRDESVGGRVERARSNRPVVRASGPTTRPLAHASGADPFAEARAANLEKQRLSPRPSRLSSARAERNRSAAARALLVTVAFLVGVGAGVWSGQLRPWMLAAYVALSLLAVAMYRADKKAAAIRSWRVRESTLHFVALAGGWPGALFARHWLRHKTVKQPFRTVFHVTVVANCAWLAWQFTSDGVPLPIHLARRMAVALAQ